MDRIVWYSTSIVGDSQMRPIELGENCQPKPNTALHQPEHRTLLEKAMFDGLVQSYRDDIDPDKLCLIDSLNAGDRTALVGLSDWYREHGEDGKADMYLWLQKRERWPVQDKGGWHFKRMEPFYTYLYEYSLGPGWDITLNVDYVYIAELTESGTVFGCFCNVYERVWKQSPKHTATLMAELQDA